MNRGGRTVQDVGSLLDLFAKHCADAATLGELRHLVDDPESWGLAHQLFRRIRGKSLSAQSRGELLAVAQYRFEEVVAKTIYNSSGHAAPFDPDSPYWVVPTALALARQLGLPDSEVTSHISI